MGFKKLNRARLQRRSIYLHEEDVRELTEMAHELGFRTDAALIKYFSFVMISARAQERGRYDRRAVPIDIIELFVSRYNSDKMRAQQIVRDAGYIPEEVEDDPKPQEPAPAIEDEVRDLFSELEEEGGEKEWPDNIRKRNER